MFSVPWRSCTRAWRRWGRWGPSGPTGPSPRWRGSRGRRATIALGHTPRQARDRWVSRKVNSRITCSVSFAANSIKYAMIKVNCYKLHKCSKQWVLMCSTTSLGSKSASLTYEINHTTISICLLNSHRYVLFIFSSYNVSLFIDIIQQWMTFKDLWKGNFLCNVFKVW